MVDEKSSPFADLKAHIHNAVFRFRLRAGYRLLPGNHKHVQVTNLGEGLGTFCDQCQRRSELRSLLSQALARV